MAFFADTTQLYDCYRALFQRVGRYAPGAGDAILASRMMITLQVSNPPGEITLDGHRRPVQTTFGPSGSQPDLYIALSGDALHRIMLGELALTKALGAGLLRVQGPVWKALALRPNVLR